MEKTNRLFVASFIANGSLNFQNIYLTRKDAEDALLSYITVNESGFEDADTYDEVVATAREMDVVEVFVEESGSQT